MTRLDLKNLGSNQMQMKAPTLLDGILAKSS